MRGRSSSSGAKPDFSPTRWIDSSAALSSRVYIVARAGVGDVGAHVGHNGITAPLEFEREPTVSLLHVSRRLGEIDGAPGRPCDPNVGWNQRAHRASGDDTLDLLSQKLCKCVPDLQKSGVADLAAVEKAFLRRDVVLRVPVEKGETLLHPQRLGPVLPRDILLADDDNSLFDPVDAVHLTEPHESVELLEAIGPLKPIRRHHHDQYRRLLERILDFCVERIAVAEALGVAPKLGFLRADVAELHFQHSLQKRDKAFLVRPAAGRQVVVVSVRNETPDVLARHKGSFCLERLVSSAPCY